MAIAESFSETGQAVLRDNDIDIVSCEGRSRAELSRALIDCDGLIVRSETRVDGELLRCGSSLRVIARAGVGVDAIDVDAATRAGIVVVNTPAANTLAATEQTFALLFAAMRHTVEAVTSVRAGSWTRAPFIGNELYGKTLGIVGLGRIGGAVAERARAFGMHVIACDPFVSAAQAQHLHVSLLPLEELLASADVVTLHVPLTPQTERLISAARLRTMKPSAVLINCARGGILDEEALLTALDAGWIRAAALDVVREEPPSADSAGSRLHRHPRVLATPHLGGSTHEALQRIAIELANDIVSVLRGRPALGAVNAPAPSGIDAERLRPFMDVAYRMGLFAAQIFGDALRAPIVLELGGTIANSDPLPLRAATLSGLLQTRTDRRVSVVNAEAIARELGILFDARAAAEDGPYAASLTLASGGRRIVGTAVQG
ncbi:MAG: NAD(P)-binding domain-containing protein, partial [Candidatus Eremiobacteraeota bacterium]|nr:NAD(P)-binding domain-containing protein [Candidatus Eremiobacteraeota bacterium]